MMRLPILLAFLLAFGCASEPRAPETIREWGTVEDFQQPLAVFEHVFWEPRDTTTTRGFLRNEDLTGMRVMEIGTGSGLLSLCALQAGAAYVLATDINPHAVANARYNAERLGFEDRLEVRQVAPDNRGAFSVLRPDERFDLILSNPPWEDAAPARIEDYALYDPGWLLLQSLLNGLPERLTPRGRLWLAYGTRSGVEAVFREAERRGYPVAVLEGHDVANLPADFLPALTLQIRLPISRLRGSAPHRRGAACCAPAPRAVRSRGSLVASSTKPPRERQNCVDGGDDHLNVIELSLGTDGSMTQCWN